MASTNITEGQGGLKKVSLQHKSGASAEVYLWGATLTSYRSPCGKEHIFVSPGAIWDGKKAIRGGVPVVFPQFGQPDKAMAQHGFARSTEWSLTAFYDSEDSVCATFSMKDTEATLEKWPHAFVLDYLVKLTADSLTMRLRVTNSGDADFNFQALLHTYFKIPDVAQAAVCGLKGLSYIDKVSGGDTKTESEEKVVLPDFTDRVYINPSEAAGEVKITGEADSLLYTVVNAATTQDGTSKPTPCDVVVWNPYEGASPGDLPPPAYKDFVCVEPLLVNATHKLGPKQSAELSQTIIPA